MTCDFLKCLKCTRGCSEPFESPPGKGEFHQVERSSYSSLKILGGTYASTCVSFVVLSFQLRPAHRDYDRRGVSRYVHAVEHARGAWPHRTSHSEGEGLIQAKKDIFFKIPVLRSGPPFQLYKVLQSMS